MKETKKQMMSRILSLFMVLCLVVSGFMPMTVRAAETGTADLYRVYFTPHDSETAEEIKDGKLELDADDISTAGIAGQFSVAGVPEGAGVRFSCDDGNNADNIAINLSNGNLHIFNVGKATVKATVTLEDGTSQEAGTVEVTAYRKEIEELRLKIDGKDVTNKSITVAGSEEKQIVAEVRYKGSSDFVEVIPQKFSHVPDVKDYIWNVETSGYFHFVQPGTASMIVSPYSNPDLKASVKITSTYVPVTEVYPAIEGVNEVHARNSMSNTGKDFTAIETTIVVLPENASYKDNFEVESSNPEIGVYSSSLPKAYVPYSRGDVTFTVKLQDKDPETGIKIVEGSRNVTFTYKNPLKNVTVEEPEIVAKTGQSQKLRLNYEGTRTDGYSITEPEMKWTFDQPGIVNIFRPSAFVQIRTAEVPDFGDWVGSGEYYIQGLKEGTVTATGVPVDDTNKIEPVTLKITVEDSEADKPDIPALVKTGKDSAIAGIRSAHEKSGYRFNDEWDLYAMIRAGEVITDEEKAQYYDSVAATVKKWKPSIKPTEIERVCLALTILGKDITNVNGVNLAEMIYNHKNLDMGSNELIFALLALDAAGIRIPENALWSRNDMIEALLTFRNPDGGIVLFKGGNSDIDLTGMAVQALTKYREIPEIRKVIDEAVDFLKGSLKTGYDASSAESNVQILLALTTMGIDPTTAEGFSDPYNNLIVSLMKYHVPGKGFTHMAGGEEANAIATVQALEGLDSYDHFVKGEPAYWDLHPQLPDPIPDPEFPYSGVTTVTMERFTLGDTDYYKGPTRIPYNYQKTNTPVKATDLAYGEGTLKTGSYQNADEGIFFGYQIKGIRDDREPDGYLMNGAKGPDSKWIMTINNKVVRDPVSTEFSNLHAGDVVRFMYTMDNGQDIGVENGALKVNKDALIRRIAEIPSGELKPDDASDSKYQAYKEAQKVLKDLKATQKAVDTALGRLNAAMAGLDVRPTVSLKVMPQALEIFTSEEKMIRIMTEPANTTDSLKWSTDAPEVISFDPKTGKVKGLKEGNAILTLQSGDQTAKVNVTVILKITEEDLAAASSVSEKINALSDKLTIADKAAVDAAKAGYDHLTPVQKTFITTEELDKLDRSVETMKKLVEEAEHEKEKTDKEAADRVIAEIEEAVKNVTLQNKDAVSAAAKSYDALTDDQKALIGEDVIGKLRDAEKEIERLEAEAEKEEADRKAEADKKAADKVAAEITEAVKNVTADSKEALTAARKAYDALTADQKKLTGDAEAKLTAAEKQYEELVKAARAKLNLKFRAGKGSITLRWNRISGSRGYDIFRYDTKTKKYRLIDRVSGTQSSYTVKRLDGRKGKKLEAGKTYRFAVRSYEIVSGKKSYKKTETITAAVSPVKTVISGLKKISSKKLRLTWKKQKGVSGYRIYMKSSKKGSYKAVKDIKAGKAARYIMSGKKNKTYFFKMCAYKTVGKTRVYGPMSAEKKLKLK